MNDVLNLEHCDSEFVDEHELSIIVINYKTREMTLECLRSIFRETRQRNFEVIVLDNASEDGFVAAADAEFSTRIRLISSQKNMGFAAGNNFAARNARGKYLLLLNPDTVVLEGAIDALIDFAKKMPSAGIWGGRTIFADGTLNPASCWGKQTVWSLFCQASGLSSVFRRSSLFNPEGLGGWNRIGEREVDIVTGCFLLIRREFWSQLNGFCEDFFMYGEEADLCLRAKAHGAFPMVTSAASIIHYGGASEKLKADKMVRLLKAKNQLIDRHFTPMSAGLAKMLLFCWPVTRFLVHGVFALAGRSRSSLSRNDWKQILIRQKEWFGRGAISLSSAKLQ